MVDTGFLRIFDEQHSSREFISLNHRRKDSQVTKHRSEFRTISRTEEIEGEIERIRRLWQEGYNFETREIYQVEPLIEGLNLLDEFINEYWPDFSADEKIRLVTQAGYLKELKQLNFDSGFRTFLRAIFAGKFLRNSVKLRWQNANRTVAESILSLAKKDFEKVQASVPLAEYHLLLREYNSLEETTYLLRSPINAQRLLSSLEQIKAGKGVKRELLD